MAYCRIANSEASEKMTDDLLIMWPNDDIIIRNHASDVRQRIKRVGLDEYELSYDAHHVEYRKIKTMNQEETIATITKMIKWMMDN